MEPVTSRVAEATHVPLRRLAQEQRSRDALERALPDEATTHLPTAAFTSSI
jgi:hypothetical protein